MLAANPFPTKSSMYLNINIIKNTNIAMKNVIIKGPMYDFNMNL